MTLPDRLSLRGLQARGRHGVLPEERKAGQTFVVDLTLGLDTRGVAASDELTTTVDYGLLAKRVVDVVHGEPVNLIETLAERIADVCLADSRIEEVEVTVHKPEAPIQVPFEDVSITVVRGRP